jgi:hypothetical protein
VRLDVLRTGSCRRVRTALLLLQLLQLLHLPIELDSPASDTHEDQRPECVEAAHAEGSGLLRLTPNVGTRVEDHVAGCPHASSSPTLLDVTVTAFRSSTSTLQRS